MYQQIIKAGCFKSNLEIKKKKKIETTEIEFLIEVLSTFNSVFLSFSVCANKTSCTEYWTYSTLVEVKSSVPLRLLRGAYIQVNCSSLDLKRKTEANAALYRLHYRQLNGKSTITRACFKSYILNRKQPSRKKSPTAHRIIKVKLLYFSEPLFLAV